MQPPEQPSPERQFAQSEAVQPHVRPQPVRRPRRKFRLTTWMKIVLAVIGVMAAAGVIFHAMTRPVIRIVDNPSRAQELILLGEGDEYAALVDYGRSVVFGDMHGLTHSTTLPSGGGLAASRDGQVVVAAIYKEDNTGNKRTVSLLNALTAKGLWSVPASLYAVRSVALSDDGAKCLLRYSDGFEWRETWTGRIISQGFVRFGNGSNYRADVSRDARLAALACDREVQVWELEPPRLVATLEGHYGQVMNVKFGPDGRDVLASDSSDCVRLWDISTRACKRVWEPSGLVNNGNGLVLAGDGRHFLQVWGADRYARVWDIMQDQPVAQVRRNDNWGSYGTPAFSRDCGDVFIPVLPDKIVLWRWRN